MKYVVISRMTSGVENSRKAIEVFTKAGLSPGTVGVYAATDGKTIISIVEGEEGIDMDGLAIAYTYAPFFEDTKVFPVVPVDDAWMQAVLAAQANWG